jgi:dTDP-4-amino-4,6-dideoxygalactose transaminase
MEAANAVSVVPKLASDATAYRRRALQCESGREAIATFARAAGVTPGDTVLCPAYVGWSPREGSGVLDPLTSLGLTVRFYRMNADLSVDLGDLASCLNDGRPAGVIIIHFFGHVDPSYSEVVRLIRNAGAWCLEDEAHALFTDLVVGASGRLGDASVLSLHKMLPVHGGGALLINPASNLDLENLDAPGVSATMLWDHDLAAIAEQRRRNTADIAEMLIPLAGRVDPLWSAAGNGEILQTYPVIVRDANRDYVYKMMNARGYGVVSLYHTLVDGIQPAEYPLSHALSRSILNLPIHQDLRTQHLADLIAHLTSVLDELGRDDRA